MKTSLYIITTLFTFSLTPMLARSESAPDRNLNPTELTPTVPALATFEESIPDQDNTFRLALKMLAPVTPEVADFYETTNEVTPSTSDLSPTAPETADFNDSI